MATKKPLTPYNVVLENLRKMRASATDAQIEEGRAWYPSMGQMIRDTADEAAHVTGDRPSDALAVGVFAAFSQNQSWKGNVTMATRYLHGTGSGMARVLAECDVLEMGEDPTDYNVLGLKRADFCANLLGDESRVTCDRWHLRAALNLAQYDPERPDTFPGGVGRSRDKKTGKWIVCAKLDPEMHALITAATIVVARENGETPAACQAVIWCAVRGDGQ